MKGKLKFACDHGKYCKFQNHWEKLEYVAPLKRYTKKTPFCMSYSKFFLTYGLQDNHWVGHALMKPVDATSFQKRQALREGNNDESENFEMDILDKGAPDKPLGGPIKFQTG